MIKKIVHLLHYYFFQVTNHHSNLFVRLAALEARAAKKLSTFQISYLPIIFFAFGLTLGKVESL